MTARISMSLDLAISLPLPFPNRVLLRDLSFALVAEREQVAIDEVGMRGGEAVRQARIVDLRRTLDQLC